MQSKRSRIGPNLVLTPGQAALEAYKKDKQQGTTGAYSAAHKRQFGFKFSGLKGASLSPEPACAAPLHARSLLTGFAPPSEEEEAGMSIIEKYNRKYGHTGEGGPGGPISEEEVMQVTCCAPAPVVRCSSPLCTDLPRNTSHG